jgi:hypothetical protein
LLDKSKIPVLEPDIIHEWDVSEIPPGIVTLRLRVISTRETSAEIRIKVDLQVPTPTPTPTATPTETPTPTPFIRRTRRPWITPTPTINLNPTLTATPSP